MGNVTEQKQVFKAQANIKETWEDLLKEAEVQDRDQPLEYSGKGSLADPKCSVVALILNIY